MSAYTSIHQRKLLYNKQEGKCFYCHTNLEHPEHHKRSQHGIKGEQYDNCPTIDHILPLSHGGDNSIENKTLACAKCNNVILNTGTKYNGDTGR